MANVVWTVYGKMRSINKTDGTSIAYGCDAGGNRISKAVTTAGVTKSTYYVRDASGNVMSIYTQDAAINTGQLTQTEIHLYGSSRLGLVNTYTNVQALANTNGISNFIRGNKYFELSNHLGNVLVTLSDKKLAVADPNNLSLISYYNADVVTANDYYPGGMTMPGRKYSQSNTTYRYGFNGKEKSDEVYGEGNAYDFGARIKDPRLGRWLSLDPLAQKYPFASPYNFVLNTPIQAKDPDGKLVIFVNGYQGPVSDVLFSFTNIFLKASRFFTGERIEMVDRFNYWGRMDSKFMQRIGDYNSVYADASSSAVSTEAYRNERGKNAGRALLKKIESGEVKLKPGETIKMVSHSQGPAYAAGMAEVLVIAGYKVEVSYNIAPKQPGDIKNSKQIGRIVQYSSPNDFIAPQSKMQVADQVRDDVVPKSKQSRISGGGYIIDSYHDKNSTDPNSDKTGIFTIPQGQDGAVKPRKDIPN